jgi:PLP dependent protein
MISDNLHRLEDNISRCCHRCGRSRSEISLIAVSKTQQIESIRECLNAGITDLGENKAQELKEKAEKLTGNFSWHFIGHLQTNKVKYIVGHAEYIHSVESLKVAQEINLRSSIMERKQKVLLEINTSGETTKFGLSADKEINETADYIERCPNLILSGLMTMAPLTDNDEIIGKCFTKLRVLKEKLNSGGFRLSELSMGMTNDYEIAIREGATMLRIGTAIFGDRNYQHQR